MEGGSLHASIRTVTARTSDRVPPQPRRWTTEEFHFVGSHGLFEGRRPILIDGAILEQGQATPAIACAIGLVADALHATFPSGWRIRQQQPLPLGSHTDPVPNVSIVRGSPRDTPGRHPTSASLIVEIADANNFVMNTTTKVELYASAGIADYWVLDLTGRQLLVFRDPHGHGYDTHLTFGPADRVSPLAAPAATVRVADLLP